MNTYNFNDRAAIVTGGAQGFGLAITKRLIQYGGKVIIWDIDEEAIKKAEKEMNSENLSFQLVDVTDFEAIENSVKKLETKLGKIDIFVNNAGIT